MKTTRYDWLDVLQRLRLCYITFAFWCRLPQLSCPLACVADDGRTAVSNGRRHVRKSGIVNSEMINRGFFRSDWFRQPTKSSSQRSVKYELWAQRVWLGNFTEAAVGKKGSCFTCFYLMLNECSCVNPIFSWNCQIYRRILLKSTHLFFSLLERWDKMVTCR